MGLEICWYLNGKPCPVVRLQLEAVATCDRNTGEALWVSRWQAFTSSGVLIPSALSVCKSMLPLKYYPRRVCYSRSGVLVLSALSVLKSMLAAEMRFVLRTNLQTRCTKTMCLEVLLVLLSPWRVRA
jgi:hypothetical protein